MRQFRVFRTLAMAVRIWARNAVPLVLLSALLYGPVALWVATASPPDDTSIETLVLRSVARPLAAQGALTALLAPLVTYRVIRELEGATVPFLVSARAGLRGIATAVFAAVVTWFLALVPVLGPFLMLFAACVWFVAPAAAVAERLRPGPALTRSAELTRGRRLAIFGMSVLPELMGTGLALTYSSTTLTRPGVADPVGTIRDFTLVVLAVVAVFQVLRTVVAAVAYAFLRADKDGLTVTELGKVFE